MAPSAVTHLPRDYLELPEAFDRTGRALFIKDWTGEEVEEVERDGPVERFGSLWEARSPEADRYKTTRLALFEELWEERIGVTGIRAAGQKGDIPYWAWKNDVGEFTISIRDNRVTGGIDGNTETWRVRIDRKDIGRYIRRLRKAVGRAKAQEKRPENVGGRPTTHDWPDILDRVAAEYGSGNPPPSISECARRVLAGLKKDDRAEPTLGHLRWKIGEWLAERAESV